MSQPDLDCYLRFGCHIKNKQKKKRLKLVLQRSPNLQTAVLFLLGLGRYLAFPPRRRGPLHHGGHPRGPWLPSADEGRHRSRVRQRRGPEAAEATQSPLPRPGDLCHRPESRPGNDRRWPHVSVTRPELKSLFNTIAK